MGNNIYVPTAPQQNQMMPGYFPQQQQMFAPSPMPQPQFGGGVPFQGAIGISYHTTTVGVIPAPGAPVVAQMPMPFSGFPQQQQQQQQQPQWIQIPQNHFNGMM
jgi:hypothetical protein